MSAIANANVAMFLLLGGVFGLSMAATGASTSALTTLLAVRYYKFGGWREAGWLMGQYKVTESVRC